MTIRSRRFTLIVLFALMYLLVACFGKTSPTPSSPSAVPTLGGERSATMLPTPTVVSEAAISPSPTPPPAGQVIIRFACYDYLRSAYEDLAQAFNREHPDIRVRVESLNQLTSAEGLSDSERVKRVAQAVDTFVWYNISPTEGILQGYLLDLQPFIDADAAFRSDDFLPGLLEGLQWRKGQWGLPAEVEPFVIIYQKDAFDAAGVAYPELDWTWDDLLEKALALTKREEGEITLYGFGDPFGYAIKPYVEAHAGTLVDELADPPQPRLDDPVVVEALQGYADLALRHQVMPNHAQLSDDQNNRLMKFGKLAMWADNLSEFTYFSASPNLGLAPFPRGMIETNPLLIKPYYISAGTAHPQESWHWITYLSRHFEGVRNVPPARHSTLDAGFRIRVGEETTDFVLAAVESGTPLEGSLLVYWPLHDAAQAVLKGEKTAGQALAAAQARVLKLAAQLTSIQPETIAVATPEPRELRTPVTFATLEDPAPYHQTAMAFNQEREDIWVEVKPLSPFSEGVKGRELAALAEAGDTFVLRAPTLDAEARQHLLNLQPLLEADPGFSLDDLPGPLAWTGYPASLTALKQEGALWGLPLSVDPVMIYYNQELFDQAGLAYPQPSWTWDDFRKAAVALTHGEGKDRQYGFVSSLPATEVSLWLQGQGGSLVDDPRQPASVIFDHPQVVAALRWYADLAAQGVMPHPGQGGYEVVQSGRGAMWTAYSRDRSTRFIQELGFPVGIASLPRGERAVGEFQFSGAFMAAQAAYPQASWRWLKYLTEQAGVAEGVPARRSVAASPAFQEQAGKWTEALLASLEYETNEDGHLRAIAPWYPWAYRWFEEGVEKVLRGEAGVDEALADAQAKVEAFLGCLGDEALTGDKGLYEGCATKVESAR